ncbi:MAG: hypothetical protein WKF30_12420 [Pyrinomonadaceae bacterium]
MHRKAAHEVAVRLVNIEIENQIVEVFTADFTNGNEEMRFRFPHHVPFLVRSVADFVKRLAVNDALGVIGEFSFAALTHLNPCLHIKLV